MCFNIYNCKVQYFGKYNILFFSQELDLKKGNLLAWRNHFQVSRNHRLHEVTVT